MTWHLLNRRGQSVRETIADTRAEAIAVLGPLRHGFTVVSAASLSIGPVRTHRRKDASKAREISGAQRQAVAEANTRRMLARIAERRRAA